ncbi:glycoside hydrolase family 65 protein [Lachnospiraceae bacterium]|nr:glycoside hydrolase family 65 protein [Lachnospiraceae bacterium]
MNTERRPIYPVEPWTITETSFDRANNYRNETTFALSNGYIGTRGTYEEAYPFDIDTGLEGNFVNGFYESGEIRYGEANFGSPLRSQSLLNLPNMKETRLYIGDELFSMEEGKTEAYSRTLHLKDGVLERKLIWTSPLGKRVQIQIKRLVSFELKNIMAICYQVTPLNFSGEIRFTSRLQADVENHTRKTNPIVDYGPFGRRLEPLRLVSEQNRLYYRGITKGSRLTLACGCSHQTDEGTVKTTETATGLEAEAGFTVCGKQGQAVRLEKMLCYSSDLDMEPETLDQFVKETLDLAEKKGYAELEKSQKEYLRRFWDTADIRIQGKDSEALQQGIRFNLFHILQSAGRDGRTGMGAKGLSGEGYEGHYFWDTEMYMLPVFVYTEPETARRLLDYRYGTLEQARERARILGHDKGALFPWRTINGEEASTYYPLGTAQYHINADIAYALSLYLQVTGDVDYLKEKGAEILIETARVWADVGSFAECKGGRYCICSVTGPDEYNVLVDNNFYTNLMARENLRDAKGAVEYLARYDREALARLEKKLEFSEAELKLWQRIIDHMYFPYDEARQVYPLDDGFMMRRPWDESRIPEEKRAWLYENYHPLFIMRHRMSKQADAILGMYLHSHLFTQEELKRNYDFYQEVTLHHSSLSTCIFGIVACDIGYYDEAYRYFSQSARMDLDDYHHNFYAGIHGANMAGTWQAIVNGFAGMRCQESRLTFSPSLPAEWESYTFKIRYQGALLKVAVTREQAEFVLEAGERIIFYLGGREVALEGNGGMYVEKI